MGVRIANWAVYRGASVLLIVTAIDPAPAGAIPWTDGLTGSPGADSAKCPDSGVLSSKEHPIPLVCAGRRKARSWLGAYQTVGLMFWFSRNRLVGSYLFFSAISRP